METQKKNNELISSIPDLTIENSEKLAQELVIVNTELTILNGEKEKQAIELIVANKELVFENAEKAKHESELIIANNELAFQNAEKEKLAAELMIANKELAFQNAEKEKRAAELIIVNKELAFQNEEKEKRAAELIIANTKLALDNEEKGKRAEELLVAYKEIKKAEENLIQYIAGLKEIMFMTSHKVRSPVANILGISNIISDYLNSHSKLTQLIGYIKESALLLDTYTKELTSFITGLEKKGK